MPSPSSLARGVIVDTGTAGGSFPDGGNLIDALRLDGTSAWHLPYHSHDIIDPPPVTNAAGGLAEF